MITEDYCDFETAKLLKEKGFDECIFEFYEGHKIKYARNGKGFRLSELGSDIYYPHITLQMAMKWLREVHNIFISIVFCTYHSLKVTWIPDITTFDSVFPESAIEYDSYEEATEAAIKYSLEHLI